MGTALATARVIAAGRVGIGAALLAAPSSVTDAWVGRDGRRPGAALLARGLGGRDVALGLGVLRASTGAGDLRAWVLASVLADLGDAAATAAAGSAIPRIGRVGTLALALGAAAGGVLAARQLD